MLLKVIILRMNSTLPAGEKQPSAGKTLRSPLEYPNINPEFANSCIYSSIWAGFIREGYMSEMGKHIGNLGEDIAEGNEVTWSG